MLVQCPKCKTTYKVSDELVKGAAPSFRCSRCKHTFELEVEPEIAAEASTTGADQTSDNPEMAFIFEPTTRSEPESSREESIPESERSIDKKTTVHDKSVKESKKSDGKGKDATAFTIAATTAVAKDNIPAGPSVEIRSSHSDSSERETNDNVLTIEPYRGQPASLTPFLSLFGLLVILFAFLLAYQKTHPVDSEKWVRSIPFVGHSVVRNDHVKNGVLLKSVETKYQSLQGSREVVVLTGVAVNQNPVMIRNVQLAGRLYDHEGKEIERQTMWIGNAISSQIIRGMTAQDVTDLQRLKPLKTFEIPSGDSVPFAIVFLRSGKQVKDARCEVLSAEADA
ncbi:MAG TPA: zinc-ribbon domain-containing protein [Candidatus Binatia bacterium]|jgi:predicted Zn finger-like uncharacterized protein